MIGVGIAGLVVGILGGRLWMECGADVKRKSQREWVHMALANLKAAIQDKNVREAIDNMLAFLKPQKARR